MKVEIRPEIIEKVKICPHDFKCLIDTNHIPCKVVECCNQQVHFIESDTIFYCPLKMSFGHSKICKCPVRIEIYNKYGV